MAALLKKRALAEYSHVIQEEPRPPVKKLRLSYAPPRPEEPPINLQDCASETETLEQLFRLETLLPLSTTAAQAVLAQLKGIFYPEQGEVVLSCIIKLLGQLGRLPGINTVYVCDDLINWLKNERSHKLIGQVLAALTELGQSLSSDTALHQRLIQLAAKHLRDSSHLVRCKCLEMIGSLASPDYKLPVKSDESGPDRSLQSIVGSFMTDNDPRVRSSSFRAMLCWHERGCAVDRDLYRQAISGLEDDCEGVRMCAVQLIWVLCQLYPDTMVKVSSKSDEEIRLVDDGFAKICNMVNDISMQVRAKAAGLLGSLHAVSERFLEQTLDKKLMSNMRRKTSAHQRQKEHYECGEWATGQKWADDAPKEDLDPEAISVMSSGACGAFVHGLEDEFLEVRNAAIDSLCELATQNPIFAVQCQDFLVDMLNDEIDTVRLNAINSLRKIGQYIVLREDQLDSVLGVLKDFQYIVRDALRELFCCVRLGTKACLNTCVLALLDNLHRYPADRQSIWKCMCELGKKHAFLVMSMAPELMSCHPYFESIEPDTEDAAYISIMLLVFNATAVCSTMQAVFPQHATRHYNYLRDTLPHLIPPLQLGDSTMIRSSDGGTGGGTDAFLSDTLSRLSILEALDTQSAQQLLHIAIRDLHCIREQSTQLAATARCHKLYLSCQKLMLTMIDSYNNNRFTGLRSSDDTVLLNNIKQVYEVTNELEHSFLGLGTSERLQVKQLRLRAQSLQLLLQLLSQSGGSKAMCVDFLQIITTLQRHFRSSGQEPDGFTSSLLSEIGRLEQCELADFPPVLQTALQLHKPSLLGLTGKVEQASCVLVEPVGGSDNALRFIAGLTMAIDVIANLNNIDSVQNICVRVTYPDQQVHYINPKAADFKQLGALRHQLITKVLISHSKWSEPCGVEVSLVLRYKSTDTIRVKHDPNLPTLSQDAYIELCKPVKVLVSPSSEKR